MSWTIKYYSSKIQEEILLLPPGIKARYIYCTQLMLDFGPNLKEPHTKALGNGLFELRLKSREGIARVLYCTVVGRSIIMLHVFIKKSKKTPRRELEIAIQRMKEIKQHADS